MKRAATHLFKRQSKNHAFFEVIELLLLFKTFAGEDPRARQRSENLTPGATRMLQIARGGGGGGGWSGFELTDPLICDLAFSVHIIKHRSITFVQLVNYPVMDYPVPKIIRHIVNMRIKGYSQLIDIVNFCGKQGNISSSKKHMALVYCQWSNDHGFFTRSSDNFCLS